VSRNDRTAVPEPAHLNAPNAQTAVRQPAAALVSALVVLLAFGGLVGFMITQRDAPETTWSRLAWLFASVEAIAFGAAGALFGSSIQRQRAERAEAAAEQNADAASRGKALAAAIKADDPGVAMGRPRPEQLGPTRQPDDGSAGVAARHASIARELFP
jgi:hypothetical protein